jgi:glycosyltransferase involved in cell wall biosynthesis
MRLLLINYEYPPLGGGAGRATAALAREFAGLGHETRVLTSRFQDQASVESIDGFVIERLSVIRRRPDRCSPAEMLTFLLSAGLRIPSLVREWRPDFAVAFFGIPCGPLGLHLKWGFEVPYLVSLRGGDVPGFQPYDLAWQHRICAPALRLIWNHAAAVIANSNGLRDLAARFAPNLTIPVIPNGVDGTFFRPSANPLVPPGPENPVRLLFVGRLVHQKGLDLLFKALARLRVPFYLQLVGDGDQRAALEKEAAAFSEPSRVEFLGWQDRATIAELYRNAHLFVFPSRDEGMPNVVLEAMASGLPVLATAIPGSRDLVRDGVNGRIVPADNAAALGEALEDLLASPEHLVTMGAASRSVVEREYTWGRVAAGYLDSMHATISSHTPPRS